MRGLNFSPNSFPQRELRGKRVLLAVSGGMDSVCLADYLVKNRERLQLEWIGIAHVHHGLRAETANADAELVAALAKQMNLPFYLRHLDGALLKSGGSIEENARIARYRALQEIANMPEVKADFIATAHHANDQAETVLMRILRGTGIHGLSGISEVRSDGILRPFLRVSKQDLLHYAQTNNLEWREDETNRDTAYSRNFIRLKLLPTLSKENANAAQRLSQIASLAASANRKILRVAEDSFSPYLLPKKLWPFPAEFAPYRNILALHEAAVKRLFEHSLSGGAEILRLWLLQKGFPIPRGTSFLSNLTCRGGEIRIEKSRHILWFCRFPQPVDFHNLYLFSKQRTVPGEWRFRKIGDVYTPHHGSPKTLKKWFEENGVPPFARDSIPLFAQRNEVLQIFGIPPRIKDFYE